VHVGIVREGPNLPRLLDAGATVHRLHVATNYDPLLVARIVRLIRNVRPDVVQTWLPQMDVAGGIAARLTGTPWVLSERARAYSRDVRHLVRSALGGLADAVVANSRGGLESWPRVHTIKTIVPNALPLEELDAIPASDAARAAGGVILFAGRFEPQKNLPNLVDALAIVLRGREAVALLCGAGPQEAEIRARIDSHGLADRVRLLGFTDALWSLMKGADVFVSTTWFEGQPNVVLEAAACGCPLVLSDIPAHRDVFGNDAALFVPPSDAQAIAAAISDTLNDRAAAAARARRARECVRTLSIESSATGYLQVYQTLAGT
jgi:glycosyltransferase involved in cell wall biosynthesis